MATPFLLNIIHNTLRCSPLKPNLFIFLSFLFLFFLQK